MSPTWPWGWKTDHASLVAWLNADKFETIVLRIGYISSGIIELLIRSPPGEVSV